MLFYFFMCDDAHLKRSSRNMMCKLPQKRFTGKTTECSKHLRHIAIEKNILSELNRCVFQIPLKYIKLVIPKIFFILVLCNSNFYFKFTWPPPPDRITLPPNKLPPIKKNISDLPLANTFLKFSPPPPRLEGGVHAMMPSFYLII